MNTNDNNHSRSIPERAGPMLGVAGRFMPAHAWDAERWSTQTWVSEGRQVSGYGAGGVMHVTVRFDDNCKNGHNTFSITADVYTAASRARSDIEAGGCMHDEIAQVFPELEPLIKWHLCSTDGPMHYLANTVYHASKRRLDHARASAIWPDATDAELSADAEELRAALVARLPGLLQDFRAAVDASGLLRAPADGPLHN